MDSEPSHGLGAEYQEQAAPEQIHNGVIHPMVRGYRGIGFVFAGLIAALIFAQGVYIGALSGAALAEKKVVEHNAAQQVTPTTPLVTGYAAYPNGHAGECYQAKDHEAANLCAQWRAALAAEKSANLTRWGNLISGLAALFSAASVILVLVALRQTEKSLGTAREANRIAASKDRPLLMPYELIVTHGRNENGVFQISVECNIKNNGSTPAIPIEFQIKVFDGWQQNMEFCGPAVRNFRPNLILPGGVADEVPLEFAFATSWKGSRLPGGSQPGLHMACRIVYRDLIGIVRENGSLFAYADYLEDSYKVIPTGDAAQWYDREIKAKVA